jgi:pSer/pThr/pTyr-binding forkhead associated (FHA) protein
MPLTLVVKDPAGADLPIAFDGDRIVIGRSVGSDLRLPDPSVSIRHASIRYQGRDYVLIDEGSTNGSWAGGAKLSPHAPRILRDNDMMKFGRVEVRVKLGGSAVPTDAKLATRELALALVMHAMESLGDDVLPRVRVLEGADIGEELVLETDGTTYVTGRGEACEFPLADADCSREHAQFRRAGNVVFVRDLGSKNGTRVGERVLTGGAEIVWKSEQPVRIGKTLLGLYEPVALALAQLDELPDEKIPDALPQAEDAAAVLSLASAEKASAIQAGVQARSRLRARSVRNAVRPSRAPSGPSFR